MRSLMALCAALLAAPVAAGEVTLGPDPVLGGGSYSTGGGLTVAVAPRETRDGRLAICGVWAESTRLTAYLTGQAPRILGTGNIAVNGRTVLRNLQFLRHTAPARDYTGAQAGCAVTDRRFTGRERVEIRIPRQVVLRENSGESGGRTIRFGPAESRNPALGAGSILPESWTSF